MKGHAIEARLYAEDPARGFLPATGRVSHLRWPATSDHLRVDTGIREGDEIGLNYDPLLAKIITWGEDRAAALSRLQGALAGTQLLGLRNNLEFLKSVLGHGAFQAGEVSTTSSNAIRTMFSLHLPRPIWMPGPLPSWRSCWTGATPPPRGRWTPAIPGRPGTVPMAGG